MSVTQPREITQPNYFRPGRIPSGGSDVNPHYVLKVGTGVDEVALATATTDTIAGVCVEKLVADGVTRSIQVDGKVPVYSGAAISIGDELSVDSAGRVVTAVQALGTPQVVVGRAVTAASGADELIEVELKQLGRTYAAIMHVATIAAVKALAASSRYNGQLVHCRANQSNWHFNSTATMSEDTAQELCLEPDAGSGRWIRDDKAFVLKVPVAYTNTDGEALETIPESFALRLGGQPYWEVTAGFTGGSSSAIGISSNITGYEVAGDLLGGASGDVAATLVAGIDVGTIGDELGDQVGLHALLFEEGSEFQNDRITSVFTAGSGFACFPVFVAAAPATP